MRSQNLGARAHRRQREGERVHRRARCVQRLPAAFVGGLGEVRLTRGPLVLVEGVERERAAELLELGAGHRVPPKSVPSLSTASLRRVFTVPRGSPVRAAICEWLKPS